MLFRFDAFYINTHGMNRRQPLAFLRQQIFGLAVMEGPLYCILFPAIDANSQGMLRAESESPGFSNMDIYMSVEEPYRFSKLHWGFSSSKQCLTR